MHTTGAGTKFYDRDAELRLLERAIRGRGTKFIILKGLRRIGKTRLALEALKGKDSLYLFIPKDRSAGIFLEEVSEELRIPRFTALKDLIKYVFEKYEFVFLDEFQNFYYMEKAVYSDIQKLIDEYKRAGRRLCLIVAGSSYSLIKKIFTDYSKALYGRKDIELTLDELPLHAVLQMLADCDIKAPEDKIKFWSVFGGIPKHFELVKILAPKSFEEFAELTFLAHFKSLLDDGNSMLIAEFGGEYKTYYTIMEAIALGKTKLSEIASVFNNDLTLTNRYLDMLRKEYNLIAKMNPLLDGARLGTYTIKNNFLAFWFRFIKRYEGYFEQGRQAEVAGIFRAHFNTYMGAAFEKFCLHLLQHRRLAPFVFTRMGKQWGRIPGAARDANQYEIDIMALNEQTRQILFVECKWQEQVDANAVLQELQAKARYVDWNNGKRAEHYAIFAKSFKKKVEMPNVRLFDLATMQELLKS